MRRVASAAAWTAALVLSSACETLSAREPQPAVLTHVSAQSFAELKRIVSQALNGAPVRLADDALTHDSALIVDRVQPRDAAGLPLDGRELGRPEHFQLVKRGPQCILIHERTGQRWILSSATCASKTSAK
jgi:hypothetical protein